MATLIRWTGDGDLAKKRAQEAFTAAMAKIEQNG